MSSNRKIVAVTGASGFIGRYVCAAFADVGYGVLRLGRGPDSDRQTDYTYASLKEALVGVYGVVHLAGRRMIRADAPMDLAPFWLPNVAVIGNLAAAAQDSGVQRLILASTIAAYSPSSGTPYVETAPPRPVNAYALSKVMAEAHLEMLTRTVGPKALALRLAAVYGQGEKGTPALMHFVAEASAGRDLVMTGSPDACIDQLYVRDAAQAFVAAMISDAVGVLNVGGGRAWRIAEIAAEVNGIFGCGGIVRDASQDRGAMPQAVMDITAARAAIGWRPVFDLRLGLEDFRQTRDIEARQRSISD